MHIQEGFNKILTNINKTIDIIKNADDDKMAKEELIKEFKLSEEQADVILDMQLRRITKLGNKNINEISNQNEIIPPTIVRKTYSEQYDLTFLISVIFP